MNEQNTVSATNILSENIRPDLLGMYLSWYSKGSTNSNCSIYISSFEKKSISILPSGT